VNILIVTSTETRQRYKFLSKPLEELGCTVNIIKISPFIFYLRACLGLILTKNRPDIVIVIGVGVTMVPVFLISKILSVPLLFRLGGDPIRDKKSKLDLYLTDKKYAYWLKQKLNLISAKALISRSDGIIVVNQSLANRMQERVRDNVPIYIVPQYCVGEKVLRDYKYGHTLELLTVSNLNYKDKAVGVTWLIEQLIEFSNGGVRQVIFRVVGSGACLSKVESYIHGVHTPDNLTVKLEGYKENLHEYYSNADIFLYKSEHDELPNVLLESMKYGLPVLVNNCEQFRGIIEHEVSGVLYKNADDFRCYLDQVVNVTGVGQELGINASRSFEEKYSVNAVKKVLEKSLLSEYS